MTYSEQTTTNHPLAHRYQKLIDTVLKNEGARATPFTTEKCIDLDQFEVDNRRGTNRENTMDFCIGLDDRKMLLVEAKLRVTELRNLGKTELVEKIRHSLDILNQYDFQPAKQNVFLFSENKIGQARSHVKRLFQNSPNLYIFSVQEFKENIFL